MQYDLGGSHAGCRQKSPCTKRSRRHATPMNQRSKEPKANRACMYVYLYIYIYVCIHTHTRTHLSMLYAYTHRRVWLCVYVCICTHACMHAYTHAYIYIYIYIHIYIHTFYTYQRIHIHIQICMSKNAHGLHSGTLFRT